MQKIKLILVDDHTIVRDGLKVLLMNVDDIEVIGEAENAKQLFELLLSKKPDVLIMDISLPDMTGIEITQKISNEYQDIGVVMLTANISDESVFESLKAGAQGYLPKNASREELLDAIYNVYAGREYLSNSISNTVLKSFIFRARKGTKLEDKKEKLTGREIEIIELFAEGLTYKEIADRLNISTRTVESHKNNIMEKLNLKTIVDLVKFAIKHGMVEL